MKVTITYEYDVRYDPPFWATAKGLYKQGTSFEEARAKLIRVLGAAKLARVVPPPEEVEL